MLIFPVELVNSSVVPLGYSLIQVNSGGGKPSVTHVRTAASGDTTSTSTGSSVMVTATVGKGEQYSRSHSKYNNQTESPSIRARSNIYETWGFVKSWITDFS